MDHTMHIALRSRAALGLIASVLTACGQSGERPSSTAGTLVVYNAGSLARPLRAALDTFAAHNGVTLQQENAGSLETARKLSELHKIPDVIGLADYEVFPQLLMPQYVSWYAQFAHNRMVIAYTDKSRYASEINADNWWKIFLRPGVQVGRADPNLDPNGYRTLLTLQLAERHYKQPKLYQRLVAALPQRNIRPKEADLVGLLQAGELDYIWSYESIAQAANLRYLRLPEAIDLSSPAESTFYAQASVRVTGKTPADSITFRGQPIVYGLSVPKGAPHPEPAERFAAFLLSPAGRRVLRQAKLDALEKPIIVGSGAPPAIAKLAASPE
jgi:molybdate/tungstate transport system substrate-binding protein